MKLANQVNLASALRVALLTLPERFEERELYERIAGLSYGGESAFYISGDGGRTKRSSLSRDTFLVPSRPS